MKKSIVIFFLVLLSFPFLGHSQNMNEKLAKEAVYKIVQYSGLHPNFTVRENPDVKTAAAYIKNRKRYIEYNPEIISGIIDSTQTNWSAVSILAHEIAHHLLGHTLNVGGLKPGDELACDRYSGFILQSMGATLEEALSAMSVHGNPHGSKSHPPKKARLEAIEQGWKESKRLKENKQAVVFDQNPTFKFKILFEGDENNYFINKKDEVVWYDIYGEPIVFGLMSASENENFQYVISWNDQNYFVDFASHIWQKTEYQVQRMVGEIVELSKESRE